jgi:hypothetical protein
LMEMRGMIFTAFTRVNTLFIIYHSHAPDGRGPGGDRSRPEESQLSLTSKIGNNLAVALLAGTVLQYRSGSRAQRVGHLKCHVTRKMDASFFMVYIPLSSLCTQVLVRIQRLDR